MQTTEIGDGAVWSVSSAKPGNGVELLRDGRTDTFWQSDGQQPHLINIQFQRAVQITELQVYLDFKSDESYTPQKLVVRAGTSMQDLKEVTSAEWKEPTGWMRVPVSRTLLPDTAAGPDAPPPEEGAYQQPLKAFFVQVAVLSNHQNGRDTHVRQIHMFGPRQAPAKALGYPLEFTSIEFGSYLTVR